MNKKLFADEAEGSISPALNISALLRMCNALLNHAVSEGIHGDMRQFLIDPMMITRLLSLLSLCSPLDCNVVAKFCRVMSCVVRAPVYRGGPQSQHQQEVVKNAALVLDMLAMWMRRLFAPALLAMQSTEEDVQASRPEDLTVRQCGQLLCMELVRLAEVINRTVTLMGFSPDAAARKRCVKHCFLRWMPSSVTRSIVEMMLHEPATTSEALTSAVAGTLSGQSELRELCANSLSLQLLSAGRNATYDLLETISKAMTMNQGTVRSSFLSGLLQQATNRRKQAKLEAAFARQRVEQAGAVPASGRSRGPGPSKAHVEDDEEESDDDDEVVPEKVMMLVEMEVSLDGKVFPTAMVVTNQAVKLLSGEASKVKNIDDPKPLFIWKYMNMSRLVRGYVEQMLVVGWVKRYSDASGKEKVREDFLICMCHHPRDRDELLRTLHHMSCVVPGGGIENRCPLQFDQNFRQALTTIADSDISSVVFAMRTTPEKKLSLFALTVMNLFEFKVDWGIWVGSPPFDTDEDLLAEDEDKVAAMQVGHEDEEGQEALRPKRNAERISGTQFEGFLKSADSRKKSKKKGRAVDADAIEKDRFDAREASEGRALDPLNFPAPQSGQQPNYKELSKNRIRDKLLGTKYFKVKLDTLELVAFSPGTHPKLRLDFQDVRGVNIEFFHDDTREVWRRCLASSLAQNDPEKSWSRRFCNPDRAAVEDRDEDAAPPPAPKRFSFF